MLDAAVTHRPHEATGALMTVCESGLGRAAWRPLGPVPSSRSSSRKMPPGSRRPRGRRVTPASRKRASGPPGARNGHSVPSDLGIGYACSAAVVKMGAFGNAGYVPDASIGSRERDRGSGWTWVNGHSARPGRTTRRLRPRRHVYRAAGRGTGRPIAVGRDPRLVSDGQQRPKPFHLVRWDGHVLRLERLRFKLLLR